MTDSVYAAHLNVDTILNWPFAVESRCYTAQDCIRYARGFGAGLGGTLAGDDSKYLRQPEPEVLPMIAVPLADGEFWQQHPDTGIDWRNMVHAGESIRVYKPLAANASLELRQRVVSVLDRGVSRGASLTQQMQLWDQSGCCVSIDVVMVLLGNGGFGGPQDDQPRKKWVPSNTEADAFVDVYSPRGDDGAPLFELKVDIAVAAASGQQRPLRGVCSFGLAGRAAIHLLCDNRAERLRLLSVRYAGMLYSDETVRVEVWHLAPGRAALRMSSLQRQSLILNHCLVEYDPA